MVVTARADILYAVNGYLRSFSELTALVDSAAGWKGSGAGPRISSAFQGGPNGWAMPTRAILLRKAGGPVQEEDYTFGQKTTRIDTFCYGATGVEADALWAMLDAVLVPSTSVRSASFSLHGCRVADIVPEVDALADVEPDTSWPRVFAPYLVRWITEPS